jgi:tRNA-specific 2-thiouridylase
VLNFKEEFRASVIDHFVAEYGAGRTPNPCVQCNKEVKFDILLRKMEELGCDRLATGHYARVRRNPQTGAYRLMSGRGAQKDQSYVLYNLDQTQLSKTYFPLGEMRDKARVRALARELDLAVADKPDSQDICFVSDAGGYRDFLRKARPELFTSGEIVDEAGRSLGRHEGVADFTVGQRRGIGLSASRPLYVLELQPDQNRVVVGSPDSLLATDVFLRDLHWTSGPAQTAPVPVMAKIRYNMSPEPAVLFGPEGRLSFRKPVRAVTPGQIAVAYRGKTVVAGGVIAGN